MLKQRLLQGYNGGQSPFRRRRERDVVPRTDSERRSHATDVEHPCILVAKDSPTGTRDVSYPLQSQLNQFSFSTIHLTILSVLPSSVDLQQ
jgi:hypothetical protein